jgi:CubicO group peptidase (beta-lactamase class C family)
MFNNIKMLLDKAAELGIPARHVTVNVNGKEVCNFYQGVRDENGEAMRGDELYNIYSCSKFITCVAAMMLHEKGMFSLDDDVAEYIPAFGDMKVRKESGIFKAENRIKVKQLFNMTSGLSYNAESEEIARGRLETEGRCPTVEMMKYIAMMPLESEPGEVWRYSFSHDVIAALVEVISGVRFGEFVKKNIFDPCGMQSSTFMLPDSMVETLCAQYKFNTETEQYMNVGKHIKRYKLGSEYESGGAGAISTVADYMRFLEAVRTRKLLSDESIKLMTSDHLTESQRQTFWGAADYSYGLGVRVPLAGGKRTDYGWGGAAGAFAAIDEKNGITLYYSQHVLTSPFAKIRKDYIEAAKRDLGFEAFVSDMWNSAGATLA